MEHIVDYFMPPDLLRTAPDEHHRGRILIISCLAAFGVILPFLPIRMAANGVLSVYPAMIFLSLVVVALTPFVFRRTRSVTTAGLFLIGSATAILVSFAAIDGGMHSAAIIWFPILPVFTVFFAGWKHGIRVGVGLAAGLLAIILGHVLGMFQPMYSPGLYLVLWGLSTVCVLILLMFLAYAYLDWQKRVQAELIASCEARDHFLGTVSHELRTPLNAIIGLSALLRKGNAGPLTKDQSEYIADISTSANQLLSLVNEVLDFSRINAGAVSVNPVPGDIGALLRAWVAPFLRESQERNIELRIEATGGARLRDVWIDPDRFRQAVFNLITNALKFTPAGGRISLGADVDDGWLKVWVEDTGIGIPREELGRIFDDFYQTEHGKRTMTSYGTGLGLAVTRRIVTMHGGTIEAESEGPGRGSRFVIRVPARPPAALGAPLPRKLESA